MKKSFRFLIATIGVCAVAPAIAQKDNVGIGTTKPDQSAILDVSSSSKGLLMPRLTLQQRNSIQNPAKGLMVYQTDMISGFYYFDGSSWKSIGSNTSEKSVAADPNDWSFGGNTPAAGSFLGTNAGGIPLVFKVSGQESGIINNATGHTALGFQAGKAGIVAGTGNGNTAIGWRALTNSTGITNTAVGQQSLEANTTGAGNVAIGFQALTGNLTSSNNMAIGYRALASVTGGSGGNMAIGSNSLEHTTGQSNTGIGVASGKNKTGNNNVYIGYEAGSKNTGPATTENNMLYIHAGMAGVTDPLIKGDFFNANLRFNIKSQASGGPTALGYVAIGDFDPTTSPQMSIPTGYRLVVQDGLITEKIKVALRTSATDWSDYVFEDSYKRLSLEEVERFIKENKHLPNVPSTEEMMANGSDLIKTDAKLLEKIEELTLYMIELNKEVKALKEENAKLKNK
jgi:hypothetical protein